jgi:UDP-N-acetylmuramate--alanine ligase
MTRDAASVGAGLAPARDARAIRAGERIHVIGAAGAGASAAALLARHAGATVSGCDAGGPSPYTAALEAAGIPLQWQHDAAHVAGPTPPDRLAVTKALTAIAPDHPELVAARDAGIPLEPWQQLVADAAYGRSLVAIAGTHGKSTSAGWLVHVLVAAGLDPSAFVGALLPSELTGGIPGTARWGRGAPFIVEADEYAGNFDPYRPAVALLTSVEWDHPDVFADRGAVIDAFERWIRRSRGGGATPPVLVANVADPGVAEVVERLAGWDGVLVGAALDPPSRPAAVATAAGETRLVSGRVVDEDPRGTTIEIAGLSGTARNPLTVRLMTAGRHNAANALGVATVADVLGAAPNAIVDALGSFSGVGRRLERKGEAAGVVIYDDYAHHPTAIRETIAAVRQREPGRRVWAVHEPLTYHRTAALLDELATALATADAVAVADIWAGRDPDTTVASAARVADAVAARRPGFTVAAPGSVEATAAWLADKVQPGDAVLVMGGGRSYRIAAELLALLEAR